MRRLIPGGITVQSVEIRDVKIPAAARGRHVTRQAQAERERQARITLGQAETEIFKKKFEEASRWFTSK